MLSIKTGHKLISTNRGQTFNLKWQKLPALSEQYAEEMSSLSDLGIKGFRDVEIEFLQSFPQAFQEDPMLADLENLNGAQLATAIDTRLHRIFHSRPKDLSMQIRDLLQNVYYYLVTVQDKSSNQVYGFATFMGGGPIAAANFKITVLAVDKRFRRLGLGRSLVGALNEFGIPYNNLLVSTRPSNKIAIHIYESFGFREDLVAENSAPGHFIRGHWIHLKYTSHHKK
jgi:ribosomal protein S18 acetylase RimI-like enzyme